MLYRQVGVLEFANLCNLRNLRIMILPGFDGTLTVAVEAVQNAPNLRDNQSKNVEERHHAFHLRIFFGNNHSAVWTATYCPIQSPARHRRGERYPEVV